LAGPSRRLCHVLAPAGREGKGAEALTRLLHYGNAADVANVMERTSHNAALFERGYCREIIGVEYERILGGHDRMFVLRINEKRWQSLSQEQRIIITRAARIVEREGRARVASIDKAAERFAIENGMKLVSLTPDQVAEWRACSAGMLADYIAKNGEAARKLMAAYGRLRTDPCCSAGPPSAFGFTRR
jgi:hypothetical protein